MLDLLDWFQKNRDAIIRAISRGSGEGGNRGGVAQAYNDSGSDFQQFEIVGLQDILFSPTDNEPEFRDNFAFKIVAPTSSHAAKFGVTLEPISYSSMGAIQLTGITVCKVNIVNASHGFAIVTPNDQTQLTSVPQGGIPILYKESSTGKKWAVVALGRVPLGRKKAKTTSIITVGGSGTVNVYEAGAITSPLRTETAYLNWMATTSVASGKECIIEWFEDEQKWIIVGAAC